MSIHSLFLYEASSMLTSRGKVAVSTKNSLLACIDFVIGCNCTISLQGFLAEIAFNMILAKYAG